MPVWGSYGIGGSPRPATLDILEACGASDLGSNPSTGVPIGDGHGASRAARPRRRLSRATATDRTAARSSTVRGCPPVDRRVGRLPFDEARADVVPLGELRDRLLVRRRPQEPGHRLAVAPDRDRPELPVEESSPDLYRTSPGVDRSWRLRRPFTRMNAKRSRYRRTGRYVAIFRTGVPVGTGAISNRRTTPPTGISRSPRRSSLPRPRRAPYLANRCAMTYGSTPPAR